MGLEPASERVTLHGRLTLTVMGPDGQIKDERVGDNVICTGGFGALAAALVWSGLQDQATNIGVTTPTFLTPLFGAVGSSATAPVKADTQLGAELSRVTVGAGGSSPASPTVGALCTWLFYFPNPVSTWTVTEAGIFANASTTTNSGTMVDHWAFSPSVSVPTSDSLILQVSLQFGP